jgi:hypothetical protein
VDRQIDVWCSHKRVLSFMCLLVCNLPFGSNIWQNTGTRLTSWHIILYVLQIFYLFAISYLYYKIYVIFGICNILAIKNADTIFVAWSAGHGVCTSPPHGGEVHTGFWWDDYRRRDQFEDFGADERIILKCIYKKWDRSWTGLIWLRIGTGGGPLWMR